MPASCNGSEEVAALRSEVAQLKQELRTHRKVLEECLQAREACADLLAHREALNQVFELREGAQQPGQAMVGSERLNRIEIRIMESQELLRELDLSLAGVSDNTAKQGKAISALMEQQKCTSATLDAVVRAVKRLDRSRSRPRGLTTETRSVGHCAEGSVHAEEQNEKAMVYVGRYPRPASASNASTHASGQGGEPASRGDVVSSDCHAGQVQQTNDWDGTCNEQVDHMGEVALEAGECGGFDANPDAGRYSSTGGGDAWNWQGWGREGDDQEEFRYASASSSCGSDARLWNRRSAQPRVASAGRRRPCGAGQYGYSRPMRDPSLHGLGGGLGAEYRTCDYDQDLSASCQSRSASGTCSATGGHLAPSAEMADCVKGVLARIEEALTKLDGPNQQDGTAPERTMKPGSAPESWDPGCGPVPRHCGRAGSASARAAKCRPHSASTPRGKVPAGAAPQVYTGATPRRHRPASVSREHGPRRVVDTWA